MIDSKTLANRSKLYSSKEYSTKASNLARVANGVQALVRGDELELTLKERDQLLAALAVLNTACGVFKKTVVVKKAQEGERMQRRNQAQQVVQTRFGGLTLAADRIALVASNAKWRLEPDGSVIEGLNSAKDQAYWATVLYRDLFAETLEEIAIHAAHDMSLPLAETVEKYWVKFQELKPDLIKRYSALIGQVDALLVQSTQSVVR